MPQNSKLNQEYSELSKLGRSEITPESLAEIKKILKGSKSLLVSKAADIVADRTLHNLIPDIVSAFERFIAADPATDKGCRAKTSIVRALNQLEFVGDSVFLAGIRYVQMEASFGPPVDVAVDVRSECAVGLARIIHPDALFILADTLADKEKTVRVAAVKALTYLGNPESELMIRVKVLCGDSDAEVMGECFLGLMTMSPQRSLNFVARYLADGDFLLIESAAIALGSSHLPEALQLLIEAWEINPYPQVRRSLLLPIALIRSDPAFEFLLEVLANADKDTAADALSALSLYPGDAYTERVRNTPRRLSK